MTELVAIIEIKLSRREFIKVISGVAVTIGIPNLSTIDTPPFTRGGVGDSVGVSFDEFKASIALFDGSDAAGTGFKTLLTTLSGKSAPAIDALIDLGIVTEFARAR